MVFNIYINPARTPLSLFCIPNLMLYGLCVQRLDIAKLNNLINKAEENMVQLRKRYEAAVQERNDM